MRNVYIDIETVPGSQWFQDKLALDVQPPGNYKNQEAILKWWDEVGTAKREEAHKSASLSPFCKIICICYAVEDGPIWRVYGEEKDVLQSFVENLRQDLTDPVKGFVPPRFVGHNILGFDLPRLYQRLVVNGIDPDTVRIKSPALIKGWDDAFFDTLNVFAGRDTKGCSLGNLCREFGIEDKMPDMDGSKVYPLYQEGRLAEIAAYCANDVAMVRELAKRLTDYNPSRSKDIGYALNWLTENKALRTQLTEARGLLTKAARKVPHAFSLDIAAWLEENK